MIQIVSYDEKMKNIFSENSNIKITTFSDYQSFDMYNINIINLNCDSIWKCDSSQINTLNIKDDLIPLKQSIKSCNNKIIIVMPINHTFYYKKSYNGNYIESKKLKNLSTIVTKMLRDYVCEEIPDYVYDKCKTTIDNFEFNSDFYFNEINENNILLISDNGNKVNTFISDNLIITTLDIFGYKSNENPNEKLNTYINNIYKSDDEELLPDWLNEIQFFDDKKYIDKIEKSKKEIEKLKEEINKNQQKLNDNNKIKGILYKTGDDLNKEIINILEDILKEHNDFDDVYEEDYKFISNNTTFLVETKGLNNEVSGQNVTDAFSHLTIYEDNLEKQNIIEDTKCLFFVASERKKCISERKKINSRQETIAKRNNTLIIDTPTFLNIYEDFLNKKILKDEIIKMFKEQFGVIKYQKDKGDEND